MKLGLYSPTAAQLYGTVFYLKPDGTEVEVTAVFDEESVSDYKWKDTKVVGEVVKYVRPGQPGSSERYK